MKERKKACGILALDCFLPFCLLSLFTFFHFFSSIYLIPQHFVSQSIIKTLFYQKTVSMFVLIYVSRWIYVSIYVFGVTHWYNFNVIDNEPSHIFIIDIMILSTLDVSFHKRRYIILKIVVVRSRPLFIHLSSQCIILITF